MGSSSEIIEELRRYDSKREWFEFKENCFKADELRGIYIGSVAIVGKKLTYLTIRVTR